MNNTDYNLPTGRYPYSTIIHKESFDMTDVNGHFDSEILLKTLLRLHYYNNIGLHESLNCVDSVALSSSFNDKFSNLYGFEYRNSFFLGNSEGVVYSQSSKEYMNLLLPSSVFPRSLENESNIKTYKHLWFIPIILLIVGCILISYTLIALTAISSIAILARCLYENHKRKPTHSVKKRLTESIGLIDEHKTKLIKDYEDYTGQPLKDDVSCGEIEWMINEALNGDLSNV